MRKQVYYGLQLRSDHIFTLEEGIANCIIVPLQSFEQALFIIEYSEGKCYYLTKNFIDSMLTNVEAYLTYNIPLQTKLRNQNLIDFIWSQLQLQNGCTLDTLIKFCQNSELAGYLQSTFTSTQAKLYFDFSSSDHLRYENGRHVSGPHGCARRLVRVEPNINGSNGYSVSIYNLDGNHPIWQNNIQMAHKQMKAIEEGSNKVVLRGYGHDSMGCSFADYGLTVIFDNDNVTKCILHMHDRNVDIEYLP
jgi:hypothetical protein